MVGKSGKFFPVHRRENYKLSLHSSYSVRVECDFSLSQPEYHLWYDTTQMKKIIKKNMK
jgi:hypothetical protein